MSKFFIFTIYTKNIKIFYYIIKLRFYYEKSYTDESRFSYSGMFSYNCILFFMLTIEIISFSFFIAAVLFWLDILTEYLAGKGYIDQSLAYRIGLSSFSLGGSFYLYSIILTAIKYNSQYTALFLTIMCTSFVLIPRYLSYLENIIRKQNNKLLYQ